MQYPTSVIKFKQKSRYFVTFIAQDCDSESVIRDVVPKSQPLKLFFIILGG